MDVTCNRCGAEYEFEETLLSDRGTTVKCTSCGHLFKVFRPGQSPSAQDESRPWLIRGRDGTVEPLVSLGDLTRLISKGVYTADDEISRTGQSWKRLGDIAELRGFISAAKRLQPHKGDTLDMGALLGGGEVDKPSLPDGVGATLKPRTGSTVPPPPPPSVEPPKPPKARQRKDTPSMWGGQPEGKNQEPDTFIDDKRKPDDSDVARPRKPVIIAEIPAKERQPAALDQAEKELSKSAEERDSEQQPTMKVIPVESKSSGPVSLQKAEPVSHPEAAPAKARTERPESTDRGKTPGPRLLDEPEEPPRIPKLRGGRLLWVLPLLLIAGTGWLLWSRQTEQPQPQPQPRAVTDRAESFVLNARELLDAHRLDRFQESVTEYTKALAFRENDPHVLSSLSRAYAVWAQTLAFELKELEAADKKNGDAEWVALQHEIGNHAQRAKRYAERALKLDPGHTEAIVALGDALRLTGARDMARSELERAARAVTDRSAEMYRAEALLTIDEAGGDMATGLSSAEKAVKKAPDLIRTRILLARCLVAAGEQKAALSHLQIVLEKDASHPIAMSLKQALESSAALAESEASAEKAAGENAIEADEITKGGTDEKAEEALPVSSTPSTYLGCVKRGENLLERGAVARAEKMFQRALQLRPNAPRALTGMGYVELEKNRATQAIRFFQPAVGQGHPEAHIGLGDAYRQLGRKTDALRSYEAYVRIRPRGRLASIARAQIERYRIEMRKKAEKHRLESGTTPPSRQTEYPRPNLNQESTGTINDRK